MNRRDALKSAAAAAVPLMNTTPPDPRDAKDLDNLLNNLLENMVLDDLDLTTPMTVLILAKTEGERPRLVFSSSVPDQSLSYEESVCLLSGRRELRKYHHDRPGIPRPEVSQIPFRAVRMLKALAYALDQEKELNKRSIRINDEGDGKYTVYAPEDYSPGNIIAAAKILCPGFRRILVPRKGCCYVAISGTPLIYESP